MATDDRHPTFAELLRRARRASGLTQEDLAAHAGVSTRAISDLERGINRTPRRATLELLADALKLTTDERRLFDRARRQDDTRPVSRVASTTRKTDPEPTNLPTSIPALVGRESDVTQLTEIVCRSDARLVTLTGPGGVGKTRLALAIAHANRAAFPDGVWFVDLAPLTDPSLLLPTVNQAVGIRTTESRPAVDTLCERLRERTILLVIDNVEHLIAAAAEISAIVIACPKLTVLATSRVPLQLHAEHIYPLAPLGIPTLDTRMTVADVERAGAVQLFVQRARMSRPDFHLTDENARVVAEICTRLDGLPLAIELAATRIRLLSPADLLGRLDKPLGVLTSNARDVPERQRTIRTTIEWSYHLLNPGVQRLFRQLAICRGGWRLDAAEVISGAGRDVLDDLAVLIDHGLVIQSEQPDGSTRFGMLETIRQYGLEQLEAHGETADTRQRHLAWCLALANDAERGLQGHDQPTWLNRLDDELDNLRAALGWAIQCGDGERALTIMVRTIVFWSSRWLVIEGRRWVEQALACSYGASPAERAAGLVLLGRFANNLHDHAVAEAALEEAMTLRRMLGDHAGAADILNNLAWTALIRGAYPRATMLMEQALTLAREHGDIRLEATILMDLTVCCGASERYDDAQAFARQALNVWTMLDDELGYVRTLGYYAYVTFLAGEIDRAEAISHECLTRATAIGDDWVNVSHELQGWIALERGQYERAGVLIRRSLAAIAAQRQGMIIAENLEGLAGVAAGQGDAVRAATLLGAAEAIRERAEAPLPPAYRRLQDRSLAAIGAALSHDAIATAWDAGRRLSTDDAVQLGLAPDALPSVISSAGLSKRETEVLRLLAEGKTDREIAAELSISPYTVMRHVQNILSKLNQPSRTAAATWAIRSQII